MIKNRIKKWLQKLSIIFFRKTHNLKDYRNDKTIKGGKN